MSDFDLTQRMIAVGALTPVASPFVRALDEDPNEFGTVLPNDIKQGTVHAAVSILIPVLKGSIKEIRGIPDEVLESAIDEAIDGAVALIRGLF